MRTRRERVIGFIVGALLRLRAKLGPWRVQCPVCGGRYHAFLTAGRRPRQNALCPGCGSLERHRLQWLFLRDRMRLPERRGHVLLHIAPERGIASHLARNFAITYVTADRNPDAADICTDLTKLAFRDATFDVILCSHVLEHVPDDRSAMRELFRVLKPGGWAMLQVPVDMSRDSTFEDPAIVDPVERERLFDQADHVRVYGRDYVDRLAHAGFEVQQDRYAWEVGEAAIRRYALLPEIIHVCRRVGA